MGCRHHPGGLGWSFGVGFWLRGPAQVGAGRAGMLGPGVKSPGAHRRCQRSKRFLWGLAGSQRCGDRGHTATSVSLGSPPPPPHPHSIPSWLRHLTLRELKLSHFGGVQSSISELQQGGTGVAGWWHTMTWGCWMLCCLWGPEGWRLDPAPFALP